MTPAPPLLALASPEPDPQRRPLLITDAADLLDDLLRLAAAGGVTVDAVPDAEPARRYWAHAPLVVIGSDLAAACLAARLPRRRDVVLVGDDEDDDIWDTAVRLGADHVVYLPEAEVWLVNLFARANDPQRRRTVMIGVVGGRGGAGATSLAIALAMTGLRRGLRTVLVDADPLGGGIDLALGVEALPGPRWPDVAAARGTVEHRAPATELPFAGDLPVLSWDRVKMPVLPPPAMIALLTSARSVADLIIVDLPRSSDPGAEAALRMCGTTLLLVPAEVRATAAAGRVCATATRHCTDVRAVVRVPGPGGLTPVAVADALGVPLGGVIRTEPGLAEAQERGEPPGVRRRGPLARFCAHFLTGIGLSGLDLDDEGPSR
jgi:secretion/DNA translocation related CpaE-like protein